jgi:hypothetical protein
MDEWVWHSARMMHSACGRRFGNSLMQETAHPGAIGEGGDAISPDAALPHPPGGFIY